MEKRSISHHNARRKAVVTLMLVMAVVAHAQTFTTTLLAAMARELQISDTLLTTFEAPATTVMVTPGRRLVNVRLNALRQAEHIGLQLFTSDMRRLQPSPLYDCIEQAALLQLLQRERGGMPGQDLLRVGAIMFEKGSWETLLKVRPTDDCLITTITGKGYHVAWQRDGHELASLLVPLNYELLGSASRVDQETLFVNAVSAHTPGAAVGIGANDPLLQRYGDTSLFVLPGDTLLTGALNRNTYYHETTVRQMVGTVSYETEQILPVVDKAFPGETLANLLLSADDAVPDARIDVDFRLTAGQQRTLSLSCRQLVDYCREQGCTPYYIYSDCDGNSVRATLLFHHAAGTYNHMLLLTCPVGELTVQQPAMQAVAHLFIPHVEDSLLFGKPSGRKSGQNIFGK